MAQDATSLSFLKTTGMEDPLTELLLTGARKLIKMAVQAELPGF